MRSPTFPSPIVLLIYILSSNIEGRVNGLRLSSYKTLKSETVERAGQQMQKSSYADLTPSSTVKTYFRARSTASSQNSIEERDERSLIGCKDCGSDTLTSRRFLGTGSDSDESISSRYSNKRNREDDEFKPHPSHTFDSTSSNPRHPYFGENIPDSAFRTFSRNHITNDRLIGGFTATSQHLKPNSKSLSHPEYGYLVKENPVYRNVPQSSVQTGYASNRVTEHNLPDRHDLQYDVLRHTDNSLYYAPVLHLSHSHVDNPTQATPTDRVQHTIMTMRRPPPANAIYHEGHDSFPTHSYPSTGLGKARIDENTENGHGQYINQQQTPLSGREFPKGVTTGRARFRRAFVTPGGPHPSQSFPHGVEIPHVVKNYQNLHTTHNGGSTPITLRSFLPIESDREVESVLLDPPHPTPNVKVNESPHANQFLKMAPGGTRSSITSATHAQTRDKASLLMNGHTSGSHALDLQLATPSNDFLSLSLGSSQYKTPTQRQNEKEREYFE
ncbi:unnamed protein product [Albugo candida]|uniref:Uncharacterized protein n=1 Tax=Albugo candida TaxID=65357 RepID=A0A024FTE6_9STRA|nr:unnamed protein product [Albugo candida]|eukprot:CCI10291.1 unnamed protein product [Albugo candida]